MIPILFYFIRLIITFQSPLEARERELLLTRFENSYKKDDCSNAVLLFEELHRKKYPIKPKIRIQVSNCYYQFGDTSNLRKELEGLTQVKNPNLKSIVLNQKAMLAAYKGDTLAAINFLKMAIETKNTNNFAKLNYEYLRKVYRPNRNQTPPSRQNLSPESEFSNSGGIAAKSDEQVDELTSNQLPNINRAQALQLLDAMRANENNKLPVLFGVESDTTEYGKW